MDFTFKIKECLPLLVHSEKATAHRSLYGDQSTSVPGLWLVKDEGVYLMSNGQPGLHVDPEDDKSKHMVIYAEGHGPDTWLGGDDFVDLIDAAALRKLFRETGKAKRRTFIIRVTETSICLCV